MQQEEFCKENGQLLEVNVVHSRQMVPMVSLGIQVCVGDLQSCEEIIPVWSVLEF